jgi:hypothetical protein
MSGEATPVPAHLGGEFYLWLWFVSERDSAEFELDKPIGAVQVWVDDRLAFRRPEDTKATAVMTGENPAASLEARAALAGGKVLQELRLGVRRDDREFTATLKGPGVMIGQLKVPQVLSDAPEEAVCRPDVPRAGVPAHPGGAAAQVRGRAGVEGVGAGGAACDAPLVDWRRGGLTGDGSGL